MDLKQYIRTVPNWPKHGIMFRDITTLIKNPKAFSYVIERFAEHYKNKEIDKIAGIESRGFIFGSALANRLGISLVLVRKPDKLPAETISEEYDLEYGKDKVEIHKDAINEGDKVLIVDDLLATGGTMLATCNLINKLGGKIVECAFVIDLPGIGGCKKLENAGYKSFSLIEFEGD
ncbi:adenine phosphoribosyltransferase [Candidatus Woesearchaeota archaeon]|nr:adenine phosphoribosyltransferase [Candidatus Woesearchaeota archaeon]